MKPSDYIFRLIVERLREYPRLFFTLDFVIPVLSISTGIGIGESLRYPSITLAQTVWLGVCAVMVPTMIFGAAMAGRAFREIFSPRILNRWELGILIWLGAGLPAAVLINYRIWEPIYIWLIGSVILSYWHWLSLRGGQRVTILREAVGAVLLAPLPMFFAWATYWRRFLPDREIGLAMLVFGLLAFSANLGRAWSEAEKPEVRGRSFFRKAVLVVAIFISACFFEVIGYSLNIFLPPQKLYFKFGCGITYILGMVFCYITLANISKSGKYIKLTKYVLYGAIILNIILFSYGYRDRGLKLKREKNAQTSHIITLLPESSKLGSYKS